MHDIFNEIIYPFVYTNLIVCNQDTHYSVNIMKLQKTTSWPDKIYHFYLNESGIIRFWVLNAP